MNPIDLVLAVLIGVVSGTLGALTYSRGGWFINVVVGCFGALAGAAVARVIPLPTIYDLTIKGTVFPLVYAFVGSVLFVAAIGILIKPGKS
jgi:uncharacterized membrane protein YeaQ/YmgE (transglycosylase-associated protein family)